MSSAVSHRVTHAHAHHPPAGARAAGIVLAITALLAVVTVAFRAARDQVRAA